MFCWTEVEAKYVGVMPGLLVTCRLHGVGPFTHLVDVLQRVASPRASEVPKLTPRLWKERFAADLHGQPAMLRRRPASWLRSSIACHPERGPGRPAVSR